MEKKKELINHHQRLIYILSKDSSNLNQIVSNTIQNIQEDYQSTAEADPKILVKTIADIITATSTTISAGIVFSIAPALLVASGVAGGLAITINVFNALKNKEESSNEENNNELTINKNEIEKTSLSDWNNFVEEIYFASIPEELDFPPSHPLPNRFYIVHPLPNKNNQYIPLERFDSLLYEERESELKKILVDLGATEIRIQELSNDKIKRNVEGKASLIGAGEANANIDRQEEKSSSADQVMMLKPKNWSSEKFNSKNYSWLAYEPDWESLVYARINGGCLSSSVELTSDTSYSLFAQLGLTEGILDHLASLGVEGEFSGLRQEKKIFKVKFIDV